MIDMLNFHPAVVAYSELLLENGEGVPTWGGAKDLVFWETFLKRRGGEMSKDLFFEYLALVFAERKGVTAAGFKVMYGQAGAYPQLDDYVRANDVRIVHLVRENLLDIVLSKEIAAQRDVYHSREGEPLPPARLRVQTGDLIARLESQAEEVEQGRRLVTSWTTSTLDVSYEDLCAGPSGFRPVLAYLGVRDNAHPLHSSLQKTIRQSQEDLISNLPEVRRTLSGTRFASMIG